MKIDPSRCLLLPRLSEFFAMGLLLTLQGGYTANNYLTSL